MCHIQSCQLFFEAITSHCQLLGFYPSPLVLTRYCMSNAWEFNLKVFLPESSITSTFYIFLFLNGCNVTSPEMMTCAGWPHILFYFVYRVCSHVNHCPCRCHLSSSASCVTTPFVHPFLLLCPRNNGCILSCHSSMLTMVLLVSCMLCKHSFYFTSSSTLYAIIICHCPSTFHPECFLLHLFTSHRLPIPRFLSPADVMWPVLSSVPFMVFSLYCRHHKWWNVILNIWHENS